MSFVNNQSSFDDISIISGRERAAVPATETRREERHASLYFADGDVALSINGTIMEDGERRDYFAMENMKTTTKTFVSQACLRPFLTMMWDTIDDDANVSHAIIRRAHMWCSYHGAIPYFSRRCALKDISEVRSCVCMCAYVCHFDCWEVL